MENHVETETKRSSRFSPNSDIHIITKEALAVK